MMMMLPKVVAVALIILIYLLPLLAIVFWAVKVLKNLERMVELSDERNRILRTGMEALKPPRST
jgi:hypothetical protein